jgi:tetratricopeptide (TPR) repeat protein
MRRLLPFFLLAASAVAAPSDAASRRAALDKLTREARVATLISLSADDIQNRRFAEALRRADEALKIEPGNAVALNTRGAALTELRRFDEASKALAQAAAAAPEAFAPRFNQGEILSLQKKYLEAAEHFTRLEERFGPMPILKYKLYLCYALAGKSDLASQRLADMRYPMDGPAWYFSHAVDLVQTGKPADAKKLVAAALAIHGNEANTYRDTLVENGILK